MITLSRIILSLLLLKINSLSTMFFFIYTFCGLTDILDGYIARTLKCTSKTGALLDSIADVIFTFSILIIILPIIKWSKWMIIWIVIIVFIRMLSLFVGYIKYKTLAFLHIYSNKLTGLILFFFPFMMIKLNLRLIVSLICTIATISAVEELIINIKSKELQRDIKYIFQIK